MRLKELEIQGFKSFPDKTKITIGEGITGVVGPNGSGKSNISDSIRWVLGETSSKQLRGSGKMEDVIFGGTQSRGAMGFASVALTIDNSDHGLDMDADEVTIGRRYYRSGESEYSINGQNVRLKDVYELLLDTGIGRDGYAIVGQGRIAEIVGAKSAERREIFEEASGIAKYRYRKNEAERRLEAAEGNLERLRDILGELEKRVGPLKRDSEKAQQFLELSERRKSLEVTLWVDAIRRANDTVRDQQRKFEAAQSDYERLSRQLDEFDEKSAALREEAQQLVLQVEQANADIRAVTEANAGSESEIAVLKNESEHSRFRIDEATGELERAGQGRQSIETEAAGHKAAIEKLHGEVAALDARVEELRRDYDIVAAVGTINPELPGIPFLPMNYIFSGRGSMALTNLLEAHCQHNSGIGDLLDPQLILCDADFQDKNDALDTMCTMLMEKGCVKPEFLLSVYKRENLGVTCLPGHIAIPHGEPDYVTKPAICVAKICHPLDWAGGFVAEIVFLFALDEKCQGCDIIKDENNVKKLLSAKNAKEIYDFLK